MMWGAGLSFPSRSYWRWTMKSIPLNVASCAALDFSVAPWSLERWLWWQQPFGLCVGTMQKLLMETLACFGWIRLEGSIVRKNTFLEKWLHFSAFFGWGWYTTTYTHWQSSRSVPSFCLDWDWFSVCGISRQMDVEKYPETHSRSQHHYLQWYANIPASSKGCCLNPTP